MTLSKGNVEVCHQGMNVIVATCCHLEWDLQPNQNESLQVSLGIILDAANIIILYGLLNSFCVLQCVNRQCH
jgi:hypothetical protein